MTRDMCKNPMAFLLHEQGNLLQALRPARRCHCPVRACSAVVGFIMLPQGSSIQFGSYSHTSKGSRMHL